MPWKPTIRELTVFAVTASGLLLAYHWIFSAFFPAANGGIGHDYSYFLPSLLDGYYWYLNNGAFSVPWFTAAFCGGVPAFPNLHNLYFSVPQWLSFAVDPLQAIYLTMLAFALLGFAGFYLLVRLCFRTSQATALLGAALFMFNGFFAHRLLIGHVTFHAFMLAPGIACLLLHHGASKRHAASSQPFKIALAGLSFGYVIYSGGVQIILPLIMVSMALGLIHGLLHGGQASFWRRLTGAGLVGIALSLAKLTAALAFLGNFERSDYKLPGAGSVWGLLRLGFESLFLQPSSETLQTVWVNAQWQAARHEFEYGVTLVPLVMLLIAVPSLIPRGIERRQIDRARCLQLGALLALLLIPLALNYYSPGWNSLLKEIPVVRNSSILIRWLCMYIPVIILLAALALDRAAGLNKLRPHLAAAGIVAVVAINGASERDYYARQPYDPGPVVEAYEQARSTGRPVIIDEITAFRDQNGRVLMPVFRNDTLMEGASQLLCYEPIFGYRLEAFPLQQMRPGPVQEVVGDRFNLKNPACYVYGESNACEPGDHFLVSQAGAARALTHYRPFDFERPPWQRGADIASLVSLAAIVLFLLAYPALLRREGVARREPGGDQVAG